MSKNKEIAEIFSKMADIMEFLGENPYRINTYRRVAEVLSELGVDVEELVKTGKIYQIPGIGESSVSKILEYLRTGKISKYEELKKQVPEDLLELLDVPGIGPKTLRLAYEKLNVRTKDDFLRAVRSGMLATLPGIREKKLQNIMRGLELYEKSKERMSLIDAYQGGDRLFGTYEKSWGVLPKYRTGGEFKKEEGNRWRYRPLGFLRIKGFGPHCMNTLLNLMKFRIFYLREKQSQV
jgi:DNA polymerase (family 10)